MIQRYGNPYLFLNRAIRRKQADAAVKRILKQQNEDRQWELYLAACTNPFSEPVSFTEFLERQQAAGADRKQKPEDGDMDKRQLEEQVKQAQTLLQGFVPPG